MLHENYRSDLRFSALDIAFLSSLFVLGVYIFYIDLGAFPLRSWDEGIYGNVARHMVEDGHWLIPHLNWKVGGGHNGLEPFLEKPPLAFWFQAASMYVFGVTEFAVRFQSATFSILTGLLTYFIGRKMYNKYTGYLAGCVYFSTPYVYSGLNAGRNGGVEAAYVFFGTVLIFLAYSVVDDGPEYLLILMGIAAGLCFLVKGPGAGIFLLVLLPLVVMNSRKFINKTTPVAVVLSGVIALPWPLYAWYRFGDQFLNEILIEQVVSRATGQFGITHPGGILPFMRYPYFKTLIFDLNNMHPWVFFLLPAGLVVLYRLSDALSNDPKSRIRKVIYRDVFLIWWVSSVVIFFAFTGNHEWYIMPIYIPSSILVAMVITETVRGNRTAALGTTTVVGVVVLYRGYRIVNGYVGISEIFGDMLVLTAILIIGISTLSDRITLFDICPKSHQARQFFIILLVIPVVIGLVGSPPLLNQEWTYQQQERIGTVLNNRVPSDGVVYLQTQRNTYHTGENLFRPLDFHTRQPVRHASIREMNEVSNVRYALVNTDSLHTLEREYDVIVNATVRPERRSLAGKNMSVINFH